jgi:cap1 methyltransferase
MTTRKCPSAKRQVSTGNTKFRPDKMDPSIALCRIDPRGSFATQRFTLEELNAMLPVAYQADITVPRGSLPDTINPEIRTDTDHLPSNGERSESHPVDNLPPALVFNTDQYRQLQRAKDIFGDQRYMANTDLRTQTNPFENVGRSIFMNRAAVKLANIDAVFNVTGHDSGMVVMQVPGKFTFCDIAAGPGAFTQYIQYRRPDAYGWGITLKGPLDWKLGPNAVDPTRFETVYGPRPTDNGDLYQHWKFFSDFVRQTQVDGVDLVTGDGGFDVDTPEGYERQEFLSMRLLLCQILVAISVLRTGGSFVCKVFDTATEMSGQLVYLLSLCFDAVVFFKPASSRPANAERYIVAKGCRPLQDRRVVIDLLDQVNRAYDGNRNVLSIFPTASLPETFVYWLATSNQSSIDRQLRLVESVRAILEGSTAPSVLSERYNLDKALLIWNLPDNPRNNRSMIRV